MTKRKNPEDFLPDGRPTKFKEEYIDSAYKYCLLGATDKQLANFFEVSESTINLWKNEHPKFSESTKKGKEIADGNIAESLYRRGLGYSHPEEKIFNNSGEILTYQTTKHYPPDTQACSLWLRNRQPALWRDKKDIHLKEERPLKDISTADLEARAIGQMERLGFTVTKQ